MEGHFRGDAVLSSELQEEYLAEIERMRHDDRCPILDCDRGQG